MKRTILRIVDSLLRPLGVKIVRSAQDDFEMSAAIQRIRDHNIAIESVIDIGASDGTWSVGAMKFFPDASFVAIEPLRERELALEYLKRKNMNFDYVLCVAGDSNTNEVMLNVSDDLDGSTVDGTGGNLRLVPAKTIDVIVSEKQMEGPFLLKFDTHGYELPILVGARETLKNTNVIIMEVYNFKITDHAIRFHEMCSHMEKLGFRCYDIASPLLRAYDKSFWQMDIFFCRDDSDIFSYSRYR